MKRISSLFLLFSLPIARLFPQLFRDSLVPEPNQSVVYVGSYDWGACVEKIVINTGRPITPESVTAEDFEISRILYPKGTNVGMTKGELTITGAFVSTEHGEKTDSAEPYITILTDVYPEAENSNPFVSISFSGRFYNYYGYKITNSRLSISISHLKGFVNKEAARFSTAKYTYTVPATDEEKSDPRYEEQTVTLPYAVYIPPKAKKVPLILWFHGMGESGTNIYQVLFGTKANALADERIQSHFKNGAAVLAPQCPTGWLETTEESKLGPRYWAPVDRDAPVNKVKRPLSDFLSRVLGFDDTPKQERIPFAAVSYYTEPIKKLLYTFLAEHPEIDRDRIYVGGCSAGGYMTMNMLIQCPELFAAGFPICEFYLDSKITDSQIKSLAEKPLWFTYALNDESVNPEKNSIATIARLRDAEAKNLHVSEFRSVVDMSGQFLLKRDADKDDDEYGLPYEYEGHASWIYVLNDACKDKDGTLFDWLSKQKK